MQFKLGVCLGWGIPSAEAGPGTGEGDESRGGARQQHDLVELHGSGRQD